MLAIFALAMFILDRSEMNITHTSSNGFLPNCHKILESLSAYLPILMHERYGFLFLLPLRSSTSIPLPHRLPSLPLPSPLSFHICSSLLLSPNLVRPTCICSYVSGISINYTLCMCTCMYRMTIPQLAAMATLCNVWEV